MEENVVTTHSSNIATYCPNTFNSLLINCFPPRPELGKGVFCFEESERERERERERESAKGKICCFPAGEN